MAYTIQDATLDDADAITRIFQNSFSDDHIFRYIHPNVPHNIQFEHDKRFMMKFLKQGDIYGARFSKLIEKETGNIVAFSRWVRPTKLDPETKKRKIAEAETQDPLPEGSDKELSAKFFKNLWDLRHKHYDDESMFFLHLLCVLPSHQRRGLGSLLIAPWLKAADKAGAKTYIDASPPGYPLYRKWGWEDLDAAYIDMKPHGGQGKAKQRVMMRQPEAGRKP